MDKQNTKAFSSMLPSLLLDFIVKNGVYFIFLAVVVFFATTTDTFFTLSNALNILQQAVPMGIAVLGMVFVLSAACVDISIGQVMHLTSVIVGVTIVQFEASGFIQNPWSVVVLWLVGISVGLIFGTINGTLVAKFGMVPFIVTLATMNIARGIAVTFSVSHTFYLAPIQPLAQKMIGDINFPVVILIQLGIWLIFSFVYYYTPFGRHINAVGCDERASRSIGIKAGQLKFFAYLICGFTASVSAMILGGQIGMSFPNFGHGHEFLVISGAVLGGTSLAGGRGNMFPGAIIGILLVQTILNGLTMINASPFSFTIVHGLIVFLAVTIDSIKHKGELR